VLLLSQAAGLQELRDLVKRLLTHSPSQRLGSLKGGALDVKAHPWFKDFDWESFENQTMPAPYIPKVSLASLQLVSWWQKHIPKDAQAAD
jgi:serine/threonine protein kinase